AELIASLWSATGKSRSALLRSSAFVPLFFLVFGSYTPPGADVSIKAITGIAFRGGPGACRLTRKPYSRAAAAINAIAAAIIHGALAFFVEAFGTVSIAHRRAFFRSWAFWKR